MGWQIHFSLLTRHRAREEEDGRETTKRGVSRLVAAIDPWLNRAVKPFAIKPQIAVTTRGLDYEAMTVLRRHGVVEIGRGSRGKQFWTLTAEGRSAVQSFMKDGSLVGALTDAVLRDLSQLL